MTLRSSLLLPLLALACSAGPDGKSGVDGAAGADGAPGADGAAGADGADGADGTDDLAITSATLAPGESLVLEHALGAGAFAEAQFTWDGVTYDHRDYATLRPAHMAEGTWMHATNADGYRGEVGAALLSSGDIAVVQATYAGDWDDELLSIDILSADGSLVTHVDVLEADWYDGGDWGYLSEPSVVGLADGGFAVFLRAERAEDGLYEEGVWVGRYDASGAAVSSSLEGTEDISYYDYDVAPTPSGGFVLGMAGDDEGDDNDILDVLMWDPSAGASSFRLYDLDDNDIRIGALPDGRVGVLAERQIGDEPDGIDYLVVQADGTIDASTRLQNSYMQEDADVVVGSAGTVLVTAESGGPDLPFYAVFDLDGTVLQPATGMSGWENDQIQAGAFADGDFLVVVTEDDSNAPMTWVVGADGALLRPMVVGDVRGVPDDERGAFLPGAGNTLHHLTGSYDDETPAWLATYTKGLLELEVLSDTEVRLTNETPDTLDVTLAAHGTP
jgi:hypothetical protein